jgi:hypothetical protein
MKVASITMRKDPLDETVPGTWGITSEYAAMVALCYACGYQWGIDWCDTKWNERPPDPERCARWMAQRAIDRYRVDHGDHLFLNFATTVQTAETVEEVLGPQLYSRLVRLSDAATGDARFYAVTSFQNAVSEAIRQHAFHRAALVVAGIEYTPTTT